MRRFLAISLVAVSMFAPRGIFELAATPRQDQKPEDSPAGKPRPTAEHVEEAATAGASQAPK